VLKGEERPDGTVAYLSQEAMTTCILGRDRLIQDGNARHAQWMDYLGKHTECKSPQKCHNAADYLMTVVCICKGTDTRKFLLSTDAFQNSYPAQIQLSLCPACIDKLRTSYTSFKVETWRKLPLYYGLPPWAVLLSSG